MLSVVLTPCLGNSLTAWKLLEMFFFSIALFWIFPRLCSKPQQTNHQIEETIKNRSKRDQRLCTLPIKLGFKVVRNARRWHAASKCTKECTPTGLKLQRKMMFPALASLQHLLLGLEVDWLNLDKGLGFHFILRSPCWLSRDWSLSFLDSELKTEEKLTHHLEAEEK